jgi:hypothetical protein
VIVRHLMQRFASPDEARELLQAQQSSGEALEIKRPAAIAEAHRIVVHRQNDRRDMR